MNARLCGRASMNRPSFIRAKSNVLCVTFATKQYRNQSLAYQAGLIKRKGLCEGAQRIFCDTHEILFRPLSSSKNVTFVFVTSHQFGLENASLRPL